jgi:endogenous inhibitor of DNA gyrase (YacG/DUF329 family)
MPKLRSLRCPACKTIVLRQDPEFPFCSERCRLIDLGKWASGAYVISTPITNPEEMIDSEAEERQRSDLLDGRRDSSRHHDDGS